jgi:hypothetical protein
MSATIPPADTQAQELLSLIKDRSGPAGMIGLPREPLA